MSSEFSAATVGRRDELAQLDAALDALASDTSACVVVEGEPGIGKTHLLASLRRRAEDRGFLVLAGSATEFERDLPFSAWVDALDAYVASQEVDLDETWSAELVDEVAEIIPSVRPRGGGVRRSVADERYRAHRAVRRLLELLAAEQPLVVVLDDLHWGDEASIELLAALLRREPDAPVLLAIGFRPGQAPARLSAALAVPAARRIALEQLSEAEATALLGELEPRAAEAIYRQGGGNPFYLEQLSRAHGYGGPASTPDESGAPTAVAGVTVPGAVAEALAEELASLPTEQRVLLRAAAVAGEPFEPDLAAAIAEVSEATGLSALDALLSLDLVRPTSIPRRFVFRHPLVRRAVYEAAPRGWRLAAHARAAAALSARGAAASERAHHLEQCAGQGDEAAIAILLEAGEAAAARAPASAARWFEATLRLLPASDDRQVGVCVALASTLRSLGELERCRSTLLDAIELLPEEAAAQRVELTTQCAAVEHWLGRHDEAHRRLTRAWEELPDRSTADAAALEIELAVDGLYERDFGQAVEMGRQALVTARAVGDTALLASAAAALCLAETVAGETDLAREHRQEALAELETLSDAELAPRLEALYHLAWAETYLECYDDMSTHIDRGISIARAFGRGQLLVPLTLARNFSFEMQGRLAEARECCELALEAAQLSASPHELYRALLRARLDALLRRRSGRRDRGPRGERPRRPAAGRRHDPERRRRARLGARRRLVRSGGDRAGEEAAARTRRRRRRPHDARGALLRPGEPDARRARRRADRCRRRLCRSG